MWTARYVVDGMRYQQNWADKFPAPPRWRTACLPLSFAHLRIARSRSYSVSESLRDWLSWSIQHHGRTSRRQPASWWRPRLRFQPSNIKPAKQCRRRCVECCERHTDFRRGHQGSTRRSKGSNPQAERPSPGASTTSTKERRRETGLEGTPLDRHDGHGHATTACRRSAGTDRGGALLAKLLARLFLLLSWGYIHLVAQVLDRVWSLPRT